MISGTPFNVSPSPTSTTTYTLVSITDNNTCFRNSGITGPSATITVNPLPTGQNATMCQGAAVPDLLVTSACNAAPVSQTFNSNGTFNVPAGVTSITVQAWGGGGAGGGSTPGANATEGRGGAGGGGGAFASRTISVTPLSTLNIVVGAQVDRVNRSYWCKRKSLHHYRFRESDLRGRRQWRHW